MIRVFISIFTLLLLLNRSQQLNISVPLPPEKHDSARQQRQLCYVSWNETFSRCSNWAGTRTWEPLGLFAPNNEDELSKFLKYSNKTHFKIIGFGHSWAGLYIPPKNTLGNLGITVALHKLSGITQFLNKNYCLVSNTFNPYQVTDIEVMTGTSFVELHQKLDEIGLSLSWQSGGIQGLTVGGAISVGFHGSQMSSSSISSVVDSLTIYDTYGRQHVLKNNKQNKKIMSATRLGLGVCGVITRAILPVEPQFFLRRRRWIEPNIALFLSRDLTRLKSTYDRFHYYIHPHSSSAWPMYWENATHQEFIDEARPCRTAQDQWEDELEKNYGKDGLPLIMRWDNCTDKSYKAYTHAIDMEAQPLWNGEWFVNMSDKEESETILTILDIFQKIAQENELNNKKPDLDLWLHVRYMRGDDIYLHPCYGWELCAGFELALVAKGMKDPLPHENNWYRYYTPFENYLKSKAGRPHWAKDHSIDPEYISKSGLAISSFLEQCKVLNPQNIQGVHPELIYKN